MYTCETCTAANVAAAAAAAEEAERAALWQQVRARACLLIAPHVAFSTGCSMGADSPALCAALSPQLH
jgi:hypothetical protein